MTWSLAFEVRDGDVKVTTRTTELPDMNVTLNGHESDTSTNVSSYVGITKK